MPFKWVSGTWSSIFASNLSWLEQKFHRFLPPPPWIFFLLMSQNPGLLARWQTVSFLCVTPLREEFTKEIIDSASKREREDPESHRGPEKTATKYRRKAGYSEKKSRQTELQRSPQSGDGSREAEDPPEKTIAVRPYGQTQGSHKPHTSHRPWWGGEFSDEWVRSAENAVCQTM